MEQLATGDPQRIGAYRLLARLGAGGMGEVFLARSDRGRTVAVKLVRRELAEQQEFRERFRSEVRAARRVGGEWTAPVLDADTEAPVPWVATGYIAGPPLSEVIPRGPLPERSVLILASGLAHALADIHTAGLIHRDLKPSNVLLTIDGPRVIDFGIARALETGTAAEAGITRAGAVIGSPGFMAPEQVLGTRVTAACDVFCLGSVLAYAATGGLPFGSAESGRHAVMFRIAQGEPDLSALPPELGELVRDCLRKDPGARPSPAEIAARTAPAVERGESAEPWLPAALIARLGRQAVRSLEAEQPGAAGTPSVPGPPPARVPAAPPYGPSGYGPSAPQTPAYGGYDRAPGPAPVPPGPSAAAPYPRTVRTPALPAPAPAPAPARGGRGDRRAVVPTLAALLIAVAAGATAFTLLDGGDGTEPAGAPEPARTTASPSGSPSASTRPSPGPEPAGEVPERYLGTWRASFDTGGGANSRTMTITQGASGERVMTLTGTGPSYDCSWTATLRTPGPPLELGPTRVTSGDPASCSPGQRSRLTISDDKATIVRELVGSGGAPLTNTRTDH
ncbi:serine/threonine-protein kinase [Streptomyces sp. CAU 1734]|uniref:serine/threonine-protein kinase n=1 Tax=Streptomyces sp. CAU 1734 TaxID=3140360 RepID=UPI0032615D61